MNRALSVILQYCTRSPLFGLRKFLFFRPGQPYLLTLKLSSISFQLAFLTSLLVCQPQKKRKENLTNNCPLVDSLFTSELPCTVKTWNYLNFPLSAPFPLFSPLLPLLETVLAHVTKDLLIGKVRMHFSVLTLLDLWNIWYLITLPEILYTHDFCGQSHLFLFLLVQLFLSSLLHGLFFSLFR